MRSDRKMTRNTTDPLSQPILPAKPTRPHPTPFTNHHPTTTTTLTTRIPDIKPIRPSANLAPLHPRVITAAAIPVTPPRSSPSPSWSSPHNPPSPMLTAPSTPRRASSPSQTITSTLFPSSHLLGEPITPRTPTPTPTPAATLLIHRRQHPVQRIDDSAHGGPETCVFSAREGPLWAVVAEVRVVVEGGV